MKVGDLVRRVFQPVRYPPEVPITGIVITINCMPQVGLEPPNIRVMWPDGETSIVFKDEIEIVPSDASK